MTRLAKLTPYTPRRRDRSPVRELALTEVRGNLTYTPATVTAWYAVPEIVWASRPDPDREATPQAATSIRWLPTPTAPRPPSPAVTSPAATDNDTDTGTNPFIRATITAGPGPLAGCRCPVEGWLAGGLSRVIDRAFEAELAVGSCSHR